MDSRQIYYESHGQGKPLVLLNGIMMSCASWKPFIEALSANNRLLLVDFLDQGRSDKMVGQVYDHGIQVQVVRRLLEHLDLKSACIAGISYGSEVALEFAVTDATEHLHERLVDIRLKPGILIVCINHMGKIIIPGGRDTLSAGDTVVIVTTAGREILDLNDIFA